MYLKDMSNYAFRPTIAESWVDTFLYNDKNQFQIQNIAATFTSEVAYNMGMTEVDPRTAGERYAANFMIT